MLIRDSSGIIHLTISMNTGSHNIEEYTEYVTHRLFLQNAKPIYLILHAIHWPWLFNCMRV